MKEPRLQIKPKKYTSETSIISMRIPKDMLNALDMVANETGRTRNELLTIALEFALEHMEIVETEETDKQSRSL